MKQLLVENCILLDTKLFIFEEKPYTVKHFLQLLKEKGRKDTSNVKNKILLNFGRRFSRKEDVLNYLAEFAYELVNSPMEVHEEK